jgi:hypothetical protein
VGEDSRVPPLSRRVPGATGPKPSARISPPVLSESVVKRVRAALDAEGEQTASSGLPASSPQVPGDEPPASSPQAPRTATRFRPSARRLAASLLGTLSDPEESTQPIPAILEPASSDMASPAADEVSVQPDAPAHPNGAAPPDAPAKPEQAAPPDAPAKPHWGMRPGWAQQLHRAPQPDWPAQFGGPVQPGGPAPPSGPAQEDRQAETPADQVPATASPAAGEPRAQEQASERKSHPRQRHLAAALISIMALVAVGALAYTLSRHTLGRPAPGNDAASGPGSEAATQRLAAAWVAGQVSRSAIVSCDPAMCQALRADSIPAADLLELTSGESNPLRSAVIVATATVRDDFGARLSSIYAPAVIASFGSGDLRIDIRTIAPQGAAAYRLALNHDLQGRLAAGDQLLRSNRLAASAAASSQLLAGQVDSRLLIMIASIAALQPVYVVSFADSGPGTGAASPFRTVELADFNGAPDKLSSANLQPTLAFLRAQRPPYRAARAEMVRVGTGQTVLRIEFSAPSPLGLLSSAGS